MYKSIILSKIKEYLKLKNWEVSKTGTTIMLKCPFCKTDPMTANVIPNTSLINCLACKKDYTLIDIANEIEPENLDGMNEEEILNYLKDLLKIDVETQADQDKLQKILDRYEAEGFCLLPCAKKDKNPIQNGWTDKENRNKEEWAGWILNGLNVGIRTGEVSNLTVIDIDILTKEEKIELLTSKDEKRIAELKAKKVIPEEIKKIMGNPWIQETLGGFHLFYKYVNLPKRRIKRETYYIDLENDGGQVIVVPSYEVAVKRTVKLEDDKTKEEIVGYGTRQFINDNPMIQMPEALRSLLSEDETSKNSTANKSENQAQVTEADKIPLIDDGEGRNNLLTHLGGKLIKKMNVDQVEYTLHAINKTICKTELPYSEIRAMVGSLEKYYVSDDADIQSEILDYLRLAENASKTDIEIATLGKRATGENKKKIDRSLVELIRERKLSQRGRYYRIIKGMNWSENITEVGIPVNFKVPYFHDYCHFNWGDMVLIGAQTKVGKSTISMNVVNRLVQQQIKPRYIYSESGGRFAKTAIALGMKDGDFKKCYCDNIEDVQFEKRSVVVWDWIDPPDFAKTNQYFGQISKKLEEAQAFLIGFVQLKDDKEASWFAPNMIRQRPALAVKYLYEKEEDGSNTHFHISEIRDSKVQGKTFDIPSYYDFKTRLVTRLDEMENK